MGLILGGIVFQIYEIPERIPFGGKHMVNVHQLIGGARQVDAMGPDELDPTWTGRFQGAGAHARAKQVDALRISGATVPLVFGPNFYNVIVIDFHADYERVYQVPYKIMCVVVDQPGAVTGGFSFGIDALVSGDLSSVGTLLETFAGLL